eukprot:gene1215-1514_t
MGALIAVLPDGLGPALARFRNIPGLGIALVLLVIFLTGMFAANIFGRWALRQSDRVLTKIPIVKSIYNSMNLTMGMLVNRRSHWRTSQRPATLDTS